MSTYHALVNAVRAGARYASLQPPSPELAQSVRNVVIYGEPEPNPSAKPVAPGLTPENVELILDPRTVTVSIRGFELAGVFSKINRVHQAARWGALNAYQPEAIRNLVLYGTAVPDAGALPFMGLAPSDVLVAAPDCPGTKCRITVAIPRQGIQSTEPAESGVAATDGVPSKP